MEAIQGIVQYTETELVLTGTGRVVRRQATPPLSSTMQGPLFSSSIQFDTAQEEKCIKLLILGSHCQD